MKTAEEIMAELDAVKAEAPAVSRAEEILSQIAVRATRTFADGPHSVKAWIVDSNGNTLMLHEDGAEYMDLPGGHVNVGEPLEDAIEREVMEETGLWITAPKASFTQSCELAGIRRPVTFFKIQLTGESEPQVQLSKEHQSYSWVKPTEFLLQEMGAWKDAAFRLHGHSRNPIHSSSLLHSLQVEAVARMIEDAVCATHVKEHTRHTASGKFVQVKEHDYRREQDFEQLEIPSEGSWPAIRLRGGTILPIKDYDIHVAFLNRSKVHPEDVESGGWINDGVYEGAHTSDTLRWKDQELAKIRVRNHREIQAETSKDEDLDHVQAASHDVSREARVSKGHEGGGRFTKGGEGASSVAEINEKDVTLKPVKERAFAGDSVPIKSSVSKQEIGALGERIIIALLKAKGMKDARPLNTDCNNYAVDLIQDHGGIEVKSGVVSNGKSAQQWRATIGQPGKKETEQLKRMSPEEKSAWNLRKQGEILERKAAALAEIQKSLGKKVKASTMTTIINPDTKTVDVFRFEGFHLRIAWNSDLAKGGYIGSYKYA